MIEDTRVSAAPELRRQDERRHQPTFFAGRVLDGKGEGMIAGLDPVLRLRLRLYARGDCWEWRGAKDTGGYGRINVQGRDDLVHRFAYVIAKGRIPDGYQIDHLCRHRWCARPSHLEAVTCRTNLLRGETAAARTKQERCSRGHLFSGPNVYLRPDGRRECRACQRLRRP